MSVQVSYKKQFAVGIMLIMVFLMVVEGFVRVIEFIDPFFGVGEGITQRECLVLKSDVFENMDYSLRKQICDDHNKLEYEESSIVLVAPNQHSPTININSFGFRGEEISKEKPGDTYRIFVLGGSTTFGSGATSDTTTISGYLQKKFNESNLDINVEVINGGIPGAYSNVESFYIKNKLLEFDPNLFIVYDGWNESSFTAFSKKEDMNRISPEQSNVQFFKQLATFSRDTLSFYRTPNILIHIYMEFVRVNLISDDDISKRVLSWKATWQELCEFGKENGFKTIITIQPIAGTGEKILSIQETKHSEKIRNVQARQVMALLADSLTDLELNCDKTADLRNVFDNISGSIYYDGGHITDFGNEMIAQRLFDLSFPIVSQNNNYN